MKLPGVYQFSCQKLPVSERKETQHPHMPASAWKSDRKDNRTLQIDVEHRLDFRRSFVSGLRSKRDGWTRERQTLSVT